MINTSIDLELSYINTSHPDFIGMSLLHPKPVQEPSSSNASGGHVGGASGASNDRDEDFSLSSGDRRVASGDGGGIFRSSPFCEYLFVFSYYQVDSSLFGRGKPAETAQQARPKVDPPSKFVSPRSSNVFMFFAEPDANATRGAHPQR